MAVSNGAIVSLPRPQRANPTTVNYLLLFLGLIHLTTAIEPEADALLQFKTSLNNNPSLANWNPATPPCDGGTGNWVGLWCEKGSVWGIHIDKMNLSGTVDVNNLNKLPVLKVLSLTDNNFSGPIPDVSKLYNLKGLFLTNNSFSGEIPPMIFNRMMELKKVHLGNNKFSGPIPESLAFLPKLIELVLNDNEFSGYIPQFPSNQIEALNLTNNKLIGGIPQGLSNFPASVFEGNSDLCGAPLRSCTAPNHLSLGEIVIVIILLVVTGISLICVLCILVRHKKHTNHHPEEEAAAVMASSAVHMKAADVDKMEKGKARALPSTSSSPYVEKHKTGTAAKKLDANTMITFLQENAIQFNMSDLLKASAEVLGSGVFGSTYNADLGNNHVVVVKRFKHMTNVTKQDFVEHMQILGRLSHPNLVTVVGYHYRKEEKLFVANYVDNFSLAAHLHVNNNKTLNWPARLKIVKGVAKGLLHLYHELPSLTVPHGHLKSSNVLLDKSNNPKLNDYALVPIVNLEEAHVHMISYKSPEFKQSKRITKKTDVWSLGILIVETVTGKFPPNFVQQENNGSNEADIATWVDSVVGDDLGPKVFDKMMDRGPNCYPEIVKLLKIGLKCCEVDFEKRPGIREAMEMIEEVKEEGNSTESNRTEPD